MAAHASQFVWYRRLFVVFSRYAYVNRLVAVDAIGGGGGGGGREDDADLARRTAACGSLVAEQRHVVCAVVPCELRDLADAREDLRPLRGRSRRPRLVEDVVEDGERSLLGREQRLVGRAEAKLKGLRRHGQRALAAPHARVLQRRPRVAGRRVQRHGLEAVEPHVAEQRRRRRRVRQRLRPRLGQLAARRALQQHPALEALQVRRRPVARRLAVALALLPAAVAVAIAVVAVRVVARRPVDVAHVARRRLLQHALAHALPEEVEPLGDGLVLQRRAVFVVVALGRRRRRWRGGGCGCGCGFVVRRRAGLVAGGRRLSRRGGRRLDNFGGRGRRGAGGGGLFRRGLFLGGGGVGCLFRRQGLSFSFRLFRGEAVRGDGLFRYLLREFRHILRLVARRLGQLLLLFRLGRGL
mmetsp:Transcript_1274/g.4740  ORF Transcript_1274/g.4740 Transcript_1274/m.4740 type:complete len:411 (-) Transcript_1274:241-1473(-)